MKEGEGVHAMEFFKKRVRLDIAKYSFGNRVCDQWNKLPAAVVSSHIPHSSTFKSKLEKYQRNMGGIKVNPSKCHVTLLSWFCKFVSTS